MTKQTLTIAALLFAATAGVTMVACKKEKQPVVDQKAATSYTEGVPSESEQRIIGFIEAFEGMKKGEKASGEAMTMEEARRQWETTLNYCHSFTQSYVVDMRTDTLHVALPKADAEGMVSYADAVEAYGRILSEVTKTFVGLDLEDKTMKFAMMSLPESDAKEASTVEVVMFTGSRAEASNPGTRQPWYGIPFTDGTCWKWGLNLGRCEETQAAHPSTSDAAQEITNRVNAYDLAHYSEYTPCPDCYTYIENLHCKWDSTGQFCAFFADWLFHAEDLTWEEVENYCLCEDELNYYYAQVMLHTHTQNMVINPYGYDSYYCLYVGSDVGFSFHYPANPDLHDIFHTIKVMYATRQWRHYGGEYPSNPGQEY